VVHVRHGGHPPDVTVEQAGPVGAQVGVILDEQQVRRLGG
jgi:hypothetical protein